MTTPPKVRAIELAFSEYATMVVHHRFMIGPLHCGATSATEGSEAGSARADRTSGHGPARCPDTMP